MSEASMRGPELATRLAAARLEAVEARHLAADRRPHNAGRPARR